ncbi:32 kDa beta-galactoside-binding lectin isoform X2 [Anabrus simplex]|uniref:32 kDa beta-galactoside-binding lectin isoform X2 n=1 Tax=Anabrus simplex TaxID=316456 RepID=UPI0035A3344F
MAITHLSKGFLPGSRLIIKGRVQDDADRFAVNLQGGPIVPHDIISDIILHINPRFYEDTIVRNTCRNGIWGCEEREGDLFFSQGQEFILYINCERRGFKITIDDCPFIYYKHRQDPSAISHLSIHGDVAVHEVNYQPSTIHELPCEVSSPGRLPVPFKAHLTKPFLPGSVLLLSGKVQCLADRFAINLVCKNSEGPGLASTTDVALHMNARFDREVIVRNSMSASEWEEEETDGSFVFGRGQYFTVSINCEEDCFEYIDPQDIVAW